MGCQHVYSITFSKSVKVMIENLSHCFPVFAKIFVHLEIFPIFQELFCTIFCTKEVR